MASDEFKNLVHAYRSAIAFRTDLLADIAMSDNPILILQMRLDIDELQSEINQAEKILAQFMGRKDIWS